MADEPPVNMWDRYAAAPSEAAAPTRAATHDDPPPPASEADYGDNVISFEEATAGPRKRVKLAWQKEWHLSQTGTPLPSLFNALTCLRHHPKLQDLLRYDEMLHGIVVVGQVPGTEQESTEPRPLRDADVLAIQEAIQVYGLRRISKETVRDAIQRRADECRFHPVRDYLNALTWDGETRISGWLSRYLGVEGGPYADTIGRLFLIALIARVMQPGCKADYMLILEGLQGAQKSTACDILSGGYFSDNLPDLSHGDPVRLSQHLRGKWIVEIAEMSSFSNAESHTLKEFITQRIERYIPKYGHNEVTEGRQCLFVGTTNEAAYLRDATGARRFWPVKVGVIDLEALKADRDQLLAEAVVEYRKGSPWWPDRAFEAEHIATEQAARYVVDPWQEAFESWVQANVIYRCTVNEILRDAIGMQAAQIGTQHQRRVSALLRHLGWESHRSAGKTVFERPNQGALDV